MKKIITSSLSFKESNKQEFKKAKLPLSLIEQSPYEKITFYMLLQPAMTEGNTALRHILKDITSINVLFPLKVIFISILLIAFMVYTKQKKDKLKFFELNNKTNFYHSIIKMVLMGIITFLLFGFLLIVSYFRKSTKRKE